MRKEGIFWGWYIVLGAFLIMGVSYGARYCLGIFVKPMSEEYGWSRSVISTAASLMILIYGIGGILSGRLLDYMAPRWIITLGAILLSTGFLLAPHLNEPWQFFLAYGLLCGVGAAGFGAVVCSTTVSKWFVKRRGMAIGIASTGIGIGTTVLVPLAGYMVLHYGWRFGFTFLGLLILVVGVATAQIFMGKTRPEDYGMLPDNDGESVILSDKLNRLDLTADLSLRPVLADSRFWYLAVSYSLAGMVWASVSVHQVAYAQDLGMDGVVAAGAVGLIGVTSIAGRFFFGSISDRIRDAKYAAASAFIVMALSLTVLHWARGETFFYLYAVLFGFGYGSMAPLMPFLLADRFGRHILGSTYGLLIFFTAGVGGSIGPFVSGLIYDYFGTYSYAWKINILSLIFVSLLVLKVKPREAGGSR